MQTIRKFSTLPMGLRVGAVLGVAFVLFALYEIATLRTQLVKATQRVAAAQKDCDALAAASAVPQIAVSTSSRAQLGADGLNAMRPSAEVLEFTRQVTERLDEYGMRHGDLDGHIRRFAETLYRVRPHFRTSIYANPSSKVFFPGDYGITPFLMCEFEGMQTSSLAGLSSLDFYGGNQWKRKDGTKTYPFWPLPRIDLEREKWSFADNSLDAVVLMEVFEHFRSDPNFVTLEAHRVLKPGGKLLLTTPNGASYRAVNQIISHHDPTLFQTYFPSGGGMTHAKEYSPKTLCDLWSNSGFKIVEHSTFSPYSEDQRKYKETDASGQLLQAMMTAGYVPRLLGSTHFLVLEKLSSDVKPKYRCDPIAYGVWDLDTTAFVEYPTKRRATEPYDVCNVGFRLRPASPPPTN